MTTHTTRTHFASRLGVIAATVGSAVGLGNIWRFPFEAGNHGGGAFLLIDLFFIFIVGVPVMCAEFIIGRHTGRNILGAFRELRAGFPWKCISHLGLASSILILSFYSVVAGWTMRYIAMSIEGFGGPGATDILHSRFESFVSSGYESVAWTIFFLAVNFLILVRGIRKGIEKVSNVMMPVLFIILLAFTVNSLMMPGAMEGVSFLMSPDFSKITPQVMMAGMGQAFFSLSLGLGCLITYSSYFKKDTQLVNTAFITAGLDTLVAVLAGLIIFPAVFTFGQQPATGPKLVFEVLPSIFMHIPGGMIWSAFFFILLFIASLSSTISMSEIVIAYLVEEHRISRRIATAITIGIAMILGSICALSFGPLSHFTLSGMSVFGLFDYISSTVLLPLGGMLISIFVGWILDRGIVRGELLAGRTPPPLWIVSVIIFCLRYFAPVCIGGVFLFGLGIL